MPNTYVWSIPKDGLMVQTVSGQENTVMAVQFTVTATDGTHTASINNSVQIPLDPNSAFTPFADLTETQVIGWVQAALGEQKVGMFEKMLDQQIANKVNPPVRPTKANAPWATCVAPSN
jgi:hypothetical protein